MDFRNALAASESGGDYGVVNDLGYTGRYQFGDARLTDFRRATGLDFTMDQFRNDPRLQEQAYAWHIADIDRAIQANGLDQYIGKTINGVPITLDGLRAMAHLGGVGGMTKFVTTGGVYNPADANGTSLSDYGMKFAEQAQTNALAPQAQPLPQRETPRLSDYVNFARSEAQPYVMPRTARAYEIPQIPMNSLRGA